MKALTPRCQSLTFPFSFCFIDLSFFFMKRPFLYIAFMIYPAASLLFYNTKVKYLCIINYQLWLYIYKRTLFNSSYLRENWRGRKEMMKKKCDVLIFFFTLVLLLSMASSVSFSEDGFAPPPKPSPSAHVSSSVHSFLVLLSFSLIWDSSL